ncbi:hypothetical protein AeRB84_014095 [Aphanomyces euteiches]|nr:hypothetical protein AeRB84_014095 [Aphanomyces euteiches]
MACIKQEVRSHHASRNTVFHALYGYYNLRLTKKRIAEIYGKHINTISGWINRYESTHDYCRSQRVPTKKFSAEQEQWLLDLYAKHPVAFLDEAQQAFQKQFKRTISVTSVWRVLERAGFTYKVLERRAMNIKDDDIVRFMNEIQSINWGHANVQFLDEVSFDSKGMLRTRGYSLKGQKLAFRGEFTRKPRVSLLCFINVDGLVETFLTEYTLTEQPLLSAVEGTSIQTELSVSILEWALFGFWMAPKFTAILRSFIT